MTFNLMNRKLKKIWVGLMVSLGAIALLDAWYLEKYFFEVREYDIGNKTGSRKIQILLLTDLHFKRRLWPFHYKLVDTINKIKPDVILIAGDIIDEDGTARPARQFFYYISHYPIFAIPGNHDNKNRVSRETLRSIIKFNNGVLLVNETMQLNLGGVRLTVTGVDDFIESEMRFTKAVSNVGNEPHHFLLVHSPLQQEQVLDELAKLNQNRAAADRVNIQYIFAGHNHGGQVKLGSFVPILPEASGSYLNGWYNKEKPYLYVSKGFGTSTLPFRFGARSEITLFNYGI